MAMQWKVYQRIQATARFATLLALCFVMLPAHAERVRELASFAGVRDNQLVGYGLVVGLDGSGDQTTSDTAGLWVVRQSSFRQSGAVSLFSPS